MRLFVRTETPSSIYIPIAPVFITFFRNFSEKNTLSPQNAFTQSAIQALLQKETRFDLPIIEELRTTKDKAHPWPTTGILQIHHFQNHLFQNFTLNTQTKEQIRIYSLFLSKLFRHNY